MKQISCFWEVSPQCLKKEKVKFILFGIEKGLADREVVKKFEKWKEDMQNEGIAIVIVSNQPDWLVKQFTEQQKIVGFGGCGKPRTHKPEKELFEKGLDPEKAVYIGKACWREKWTAKKLEVRFLGVTFK